MANLNRINISFNTHDDNKNASTVLHVFIKNRSNTSSTPEGDTDYISNHLAYLSVEAPNFAGINPYLGSFENIAPGKEFGNPSTNAFDIPLRSRPIPMSEVVLPVVNIHILADGSDTWIFSYTVTFYFDDGRNFSATSNVNGVTGIILDQDNRNYSGICVENPFNPLPALVKPEYSALLTSVTVLFSTHGNKKNNDTALNIHIVNRINSTTSTDIAVAVNLLNGQEFSDPSTKRVVFAGSTLPLASNSILQRDIVLPEVNINIGPTNNNPWTFDYQVYYTFNDGRTFYSQTNGITLDQNNHKHTSVYQGSPFPTEVPPGKPPLSPVPINHVGSGAKHISLAYLQDKLNDLINNRQGINGQLPPIKRIRIHNTGAFGSPIPESYYDLQSIDVNEPAPGTISPPGFNEGVVYDSSPTSIGQQSHDFGSFYFNNINSNKLTANVDASSATPLTIEVDFDCSGPNETIGVGSLSTAGMNFLSFSIILRLTLAPVNGKIDVMSWIPNISNTTDDDARSALIDQVIHVSIVTTSAFDPGGKFQKSIREQIFSTLTTPDPFTGIPLADKLNATVNSWLLGGVLASDKDAAGNLYPNGCKVNTAAIQNGDLVIDYSGPQNTFAPKPQRAWPPAGFDPGTLANIDHIVVLTMENRSFDHMLGYLSLPPAKGGMGRTDVDGLKGGEFNVANGVTCPSFAFAPGDTIMAPDLPHSFEPVARAINGGKMDGFAQSYCDESGTAVAPRVMGYHTAVNIPTYDSMARDFGICHRWFAPHPGPTFTNRFHELSGRLNIDPDGYWEFSNSSPLRAVFTPTIFDALTAQGVSWKYFETFYCFLRFFEQHTFDTANIATFDDPNTGFAALARTGNLPSVTFIDPHFIELPPGGNCDGPPADVQKGQQLVQQVVQAVVTSPLWAKTLLIVTYDEHGGFFDHVAPPAATQVDPTAPATYGVRVPAFFISPWVNGGAVFGHDGIYTGGGGVTKNSGAVQGSIAAVAVNPAVGAAAGVTAVSEKPPAAAAPAAAGDAQLGSVIGLMQPLHFDHTSILKTISRRFMNQNPPYMGARYEDANDLSAVLGSEARPNQFLPFIPYNFVYGPSQKRLDVQSASTTPGALVWQYDPNTTNAQQFNFEDAGGGFWYIRTNTGSLYLTATATGVIQDVKYPAGTAALPGKNPDSQRWQLHSGGVTVIGASSYTVSNAAFPGKVLQPSGGSATSGTPVVLGAPQKAVTVFSVPNPWQVTSPLLPSNQLVSTTS